MGVLTNAAEVEALSTVLTGTVYVSCHSADPTEAGSYADELSGNGYARVAATFSQAPDSGNATVYANDAAISFPQATGSWATITHIGVGTASTGGTMKAKPLLTESDGTTPLTKTLTTGDVFTIPAGELVITLD